jgi:hypothetical protein
LGPSIAARSASILVLLAFVGVLSGCGNAGTLARSHTPQVEVGKAADAARSRRITAGELRVYLSAWEASWRRLGHDLDGGDEGALAFNSPLTRPGSAHGDSTMRVRLHIDTTSVG